MTIGVEADEAAEEAAVEAGVASAVGVLRARLLAPSRTSLQKLHRLSPTPNSSSQRDLHVDCCAVARQLTNIRKALANIDFKGFSYRFFFSITSEHTINADFRGKKYC